jgi:homogentisate 1,2-dioxygenase
LLRTAQLTGRHTNSYVPYKYAAEKFVNTAVVDKDQSDPSLYTVLTAKSKMPGVSITDVMVFTPKWCANTNGYRPPVSRETHLGLGNSDAK